MSPTPLTIEERIARSIDTLQWVEGLLNWIDESPAELLAQTAVVQEMVRRTLAEVSA